HSVIIDDVLAAGVRQMRGDNAYRLVGQPLSSYVSNDFPLAADMPRHSAAETGSYVVRFGNLVRIRDISVRAHGQPCGIEKRVPQLNVCSDAGECGNRGVERSEPLK